jgi:primosomal protein N' (replication factor Y)
LEERVRGALPQIKLIHPAKGLRTTLDPVTVKEIQARLDRQEQIIILLNRRGYAPVLQCVQCGSSLQCTDCDRLLSVHKDENKLKCHSCGLIYPIPDRCPQCGSTMMRMMGTGTQKLEEELRNTFKDARILRMDSDTTSRKDAHEQTLKTFQDHEADILLGTQMIAKGLDIPNVTLSLILEIDTALMRTDYRSVEEAFDLIVQSAGRSGRGNQVGEVIVQTRLESHYALHYAKTHDFNAFFKHEMRYRKAGQNPPYTYLISVTYLAQDAGSAYQTASDCAQRLKAPEFKVLGPSDLGRLQTRYRARIILKGKDLDLMRNHLKQALSQTTLKHHMDIVVDVNPRGLF